jgi:signal transduction histidine kinase
MKQQLAILLIEDNRGDARLIQEALLESNRDNPRSTLFKLTVVDRLFAGLETLARGNVDVILLDLSLPDSQGLDTLLGVCAQAPKLPVIVMTGMDDEKITAGALQAGAQDYLVKGQFDKELLVRAIRYAIERKRAEEALRASEESLRENQKQLQSLNEMLEQRVEEQTAEVRKLASELTLAEQRERHRISHILHDDLQQRLYAIQMQLEFLGGGQKIEIAGVQRDLDDIKGQLHEVLALTRHLSIDLSPPILRDEGLTQAIGWLASQMLEQHGLRIELQADGPFAVPNEEIQVLLFNCVRELLFNVIKHSGVNQAVVSLQRSGDDLWIEVRDSGKGFDLTVPDLQEGNDIDPQQRSFGLPTLRHRLTLFGGRMEIKSKPGAGTLVTLVVPVYKEGLKVGKPREADIA